MVPLGDWTDLANIQHAFGFLMNPDSETSALAKSFHKRVVERKQERPAMKEDLAGCLSVKLEIFARDVLCRLQQEEPLHCRMNKKATRLQERTLNHQKVPEISSNLRPDIVVTEEKVTIIDVTMPFESRHVAFKMQGREISQLYSSFKRTARKGCEVKN
ncbi:hypothetical protein LAZ67_18000585 [Cordylochernes scorpioides]|uniref:Uncharacterized protein n=1 Tax=Cordylochernes scorpioides TaxID=51811 RepID=A0ABY6LF02_9ARAC|nr:hypothetical protein LAZ67_18000585 [Cordylochernes scorpioides]